MQQHLDVEENAQADGHPKQHKKESSNDEGALQREHVEVVMQGLHPIVFEELARPSVGDAEPIGKEQLVVVEHQPKNQNQDERAEVEQLLDGVDEQQHGDAQKEADAALDFLQDVHHRIRHGHRDDECAEEVDGDALHHLRAGCRVLVAQEQVERHDAEDVREGALVDHEFPGGGRESAHTWDDDGAAHDGQGNAVDHRIEPRHGQGKVQEGGNGPSAQGERGQGQGRASEDEGEFVLAKLQFQGRFEDDEDEPHGAQQLKHESFEGNGVEADSVESLADGDAHGDEHKHAGDVGPTGEKVGEVRQDDDCAAANHQAVGVDVLRGQFKARIQDGEQSHARKINQIRQ